MNAQCNYFLDLVRLQCRNPYAVISKSKTVNVSAPFVASFSSRGPKLVSPTILKVYIKKNDCRMDQNLAGDVVFASLMLPNS